MAKRLVIMSEATTGALSSTEAGGATRTSPCTDATAWLGIEDRSRNVDFKSRMASVRCGINPSSDSFQESVKYLMTLWMSTKKPFFRRRDRGESVSQNGELNRRIGLIYLTLALVKRNFAPAYFCHE